MWAQPHGVKTKRQFLMSICYAIDEPDVNDLDFASSEAREQRMALELSQVVMELDEHGTDACYELLGRWATMTQTKSDFHRRWQIAQHPAERSRMRNCFLRCQATSDELWMELLQMMGNPAAGGASELQA